MRTETECLQRLSSVPIETLDGETWYRAEDVCRAMCVSKDRALRMIPQECKRRVFVYGVGYRSKHVSVVNAAAVEMIAIRLGRYSVRATLGALPG